MPSESLQKCPVHSPVVASTVVQGRVRMPYRSYGEGRCPPSVSHRASTTGADPRRGGRASVARHDRVPAIHRIAPLVTGRHRQDGVANVAGSGMDDPGPHIGAIGRLHRWCYSANIDLLHATSRLRHPHTGDMAAVKLNVAGVRWSRRARVLVVRAFAAHGHDTTSPSNNSGASDADRTRGRSQRSGPRTVHRVSQAASGKRPAERSRRGPGVTSARRYGTRNHHAASRSSTASIWRTSAAASLVPTLASRSRHARSNSSRISSSAAKSSS